MTRRGPPPPLHRQLALRVGAFLSTHVLTVTGRRCLSPYPSARCSIPTTFSVWTLSQGGASSSVALSAQLALQSRFHSPLIYHASHLCPSCRSSPTPPPFYIVIKPCITVLLSLTSLVLGGAEVGLCDPSTCTDAISQVLTNAPAPRLHAISIIPSSPAHSQRSTYPRRATRYPGKRGYQCRKGGFFLLLTPTPLRSIHVAFPATDIDPCPSARHASPTCWRCLTRNVRSRSREDVDVLGTLFAAGANSRVSKARPQSLLSSLFMPAVGVSVWLTSVAKAVISNASLGLLKTVLVRTPRIGACLSRSPHFLIPNSSLWPNRLDPRRVQDLTCKPIPTSLRAASTQTRVGLVELRDEGLSTSQLGGTFGRL
ncbi:hypothetical protein MKEN_00004000 [Mycena kentingensis (nom. inval.)]|nr:hypothetical protein MKEN_00004000 [Mycena kentingensis (nom. inval.)]